MRSIAYARPDDDAAAGKTVTASAENANYPASNLVNLDVSWPAKLTTTSGSWVIDLGATKTVKAIGLLNHNFDAGLDVKVQGHSADLWTDPDYSEDVTVPTDEDAGDGLEFSVNPWIDLSGLDGEGAPVAWSCRYIRVLINEANSANVALGECVVLTALRTLDIDPAPGLEESEEYPDIVHRSSFGAPTVYSIGAKWKVWDGAMPGTVADDHWLIARQARGRVRPWFFVPDRAVNSCYLVAFDWSGPRFVTRKMGEGYHQVPAFRLRECSRGVPL